MIVNPQSTILLEQKHKPKKIFSYENNSQSIASRFDENVISEWLRIRVLMSNCNDETNSQLATKISSIHKNFLKMWASNTISSLLSSFKSNIYIWYTAYYAESTSASFEHWNRFTLISSICTLCTSVLLVGVSSYHILVIVPITPFLKPWNSTIRYITIWISVLPCLIHFLLFFFWTVYGCLKCRHRRLHTVLSYLIRMCLYNVLLVCICNTCMPAC
jgi:hypothetical protein